MGETIHVEIHDNRLRVDRRDDAEPVGNLESVVPLPAGEAFMRATTLEYARHCVAASLTRDRLHHPHQGWIQRDQAAGEFLQLLHVVLDELRTPRDSAALVVGTMALRLDRWQEG